MGRMYVCVWLVGAVVRRYLYRFHISYLAICTPLVFAIFWIIFSTFCSLCKSCLFINTAKHRVPCLGNWLALSQTFSLKFINGCKNILVNKDRDKSSLPPILNTAKY